MTKSDFINMLYNNSFETFATKRETEAALDTILNYLSHTLASGESITFTGFGAFKVVDRAERKGRNPRTGAEIKVPARRDVKFVPGKGLKEAMNK